MAKLRIAALLLLLTFIACTSGTSPDQLLDEGASEDAWEVIGPGGGGTIYIPTISPGDPKNVLVRCDMTGAYVTQDGGENWRMFNLRGVVRDFEFDPQFPETVYASNTGLYRSDNRGQSWKLIYPQPDDIEREVMNGDHASHRFITRSGMPDASIDQVRVDPVDSNHLLIGLSRSRITGKPARLLESTDKGETWVELAEVPGRQILGIFPGSWIDRTDEIVVISDAGGVRVSGNGVEREELTLPVSAVTVSEGGVHPNGSYLYILGDSSAEEESAVGGLFRSSDFGQNWEPITVNAVDASQASDRAPRFRTLAVSEGHAAIVYLSAEAIWKIENGSPQRYSGILKTDSGGDNWEWALSVSGGQIVTENFDGDWILRNLGWFRNPGHLGVSPTKPDVVYATDSGRTFKSENGGRDWSQCIDRPSPDGSVTTRGLDVTTTYGVHFDPFDPQHLFITYTDIGLFHSFNEGKTWQHAITGIPRQWRNTCYWLEFDPDVRGRIYSVWANVHDLPRPKMHRSGNLVNGRQQGGVAVSGDGGRWWELLHLGQLQEDGTHANGMRLGAVCTHLILDPASPVNSRTLYVTDYGYGVWKSTNDGQTWQLKNNGLSPENLNCWRLTRLPSGRLLLLVARGGIEGDEVIPGRIYSSDDGAESWQPLALPAEVTAPNDLIYDPAQPERMYLSCWPLNRDRQEVGGGLFRTEDGGQSWQQVFKEEKHVYAAAVDPNATDTIYIGTFNSAAYRSLDRGESWSRLGGFNFKWGHRPVPDIHRPGWLYLTSFGGSVFHGPAEGISVAFEDIENLPPAE
ncbi:MAG: hypothetical protein JSU96_15985 [Acidobacteriota bacterium]|nr:MAG: hypothetical protein JSU96_15985 [Acidobacteriota bacterium]